MELLSIGKFAKKTGLTPYILRRMQLSGELIPHHITSAGTRYYSTEQLKDYLPETINNEGKLIIGYCRVSTSTQMGELKSQVKFVEEYMQANDYTFEMISEVGGGLNYKRKGLLKLLKMINQLEISKIVTLNKSRFMRNGFELFEYHCQMNNVDIELINDSKDIKIYSPLSRHPINNSPYLEL